MIIIIQTILGKKLMVGYHLNNLNYNVYTFRNKKDGEEWEDMMVIRLRWRHFLKKEY